MEDRTPLGVYVHHFTGRTTGLGDVPALLERTREAFRRKWPVEKRALLSGFVLTDVRGHAHSMHTYTHRVEFILATVLRRSLVIGTRTPEGRRT